MRHFPDLRDFGDRVLGSKAILFLDEGFFEFARSCLPRRSARTSGRSPFEVALHAGRLRPRPGLSGFLDRFLADLPDGWRYAVEVRNLNLLHPEYFAVLREHGVAHAYNQWTQMPAAEEQLALAPPEDQAFLAGRFLLVPRPHSQHAAERDFRSLPPAPRDRRTCPPRACQLIATRRALPPQAPPAFLYVANGLEGNALHTIADIAAESAADA
ncbi:MAG: DUF72 domain-containing protein [Verrucomicrobiales bacterium]